MGIISEGLNTYVIRNGKRELLPAHDFSIDGQRFFLYDADLGRLKLNPMFIDSKTLEALSEGIDKNPEKEINFELMTPIGPLYINGIRNVSYLSPEEMAVSN